MLGCDIVAISRFERLFKNEAFYARVFNDCELVYLKSPSSLAGFYAAKEAASKALGCGIGKDCSFKDIFLSKSSKGAPKLSFSPHIQKKFKSCAVSISHDAGFAVAVVVLEKNS